MIIARTAPRFYPEVTGPGKQVYHISRGLQHLGYTSQIYTTTPIGRSTPSDISLDGLDVTRLPLSFSLMQFDVAIKFPVIILKSDFDMLHVHGYRDYLGTVAFAASQFRRRPFILQPHGSLLAYKALVPASQWAPYQLYDDTTRRLIALKADRVVVATDQERREAIEYGVSPQRVRIIPPGTLLTKESKRNRSDMVRFLFVGRISPSRNVDLILRAFSMIDRTQSARLNIVGGEAVLSSAEKRGYLSSVIDLAKRLNFSNQVSFTGPLFGHSLEEMYANSDVFVYASNYESFGQPILEAASHGLPIISTPTGVAREIVQPGRTGTLFEFGDVDALASALTSYVVNRDKIEEMGRELRSMVLSSYQWDTILTKYKALYEEVMGSCP